MGAWQGPVVPLAQGAHTTGPATGVDCPHTNVPNGHAPRPVFAKHTPAAFVQGVPAEQEAAGHTHVEYAGPGDVREEEQEPFSAFCQVPELVPAHASHTHALEAIDALEPTGHAVHVETLKEENVPGPQGEQVQLFGVSVWL